MIISVAYINDYIQVAYKNIMKKLVSILIILMSFTSIANAKENKNIKIWVEPHRFIKMKEIETLNFLKSFEYTSSY